MIGYRQCDPAYAFLWEDASQPEARWHGAGDGPAHYFADTPDGAWAEFIRHEEITDPLDLDGVSRNLWAVEIPDPPTATPALGAATLAGDESSYPACQAEAMSLRNGGATSLEAPSAALLPNEARGYRVDRGLRDGAHRDGKVMVLFGARPDLVGWLAAEEARPPEFLLSRVRPL